MKDHNEPAFWESIYQAGTTGWDMGTPTPVFYRLAYNKVYEPGKMIVLGAGRGYDARMFARHGFQVTAVDFAQEAVEYMREHQDPEHPFEVLHADLFDLPDRLAGAFDYVLEYVCYCAIDPDRRGDYADVVDRLPKPGGFLIALAFPITDRPGGPPFGVSPDEMIQLFEARGFELRRRELPFDSIKPRKGREELLVLQKTSSS